VKKLDIQESQVIDLSDSHVINEVDVESEGDSSKDKPHKQKLTQTFYLLRNTMRNHCCFKPAVTRKQLRQKMDSIDKWSFIITSILCPLLFIIITVYFYTSRVKNIYQP